MSKRDKGMGVEVSSEGDSDVSAPSVKDAEVIDGLKRWLERKDLTFLEWLEEDPEWNTAEFRPIEGSNVAVVSLDKYAYEFSMLRKKLFPDQPAPPTDKLTESIVKELLERAAAIADERNELADKVIELDIVAEEIRSGANHPLDVASARSLREQELEAKLKELRSAGTLSDGRSAKDLEKELSERFANDMRAKEEKWSKREEELRAHIEALDRELAKASIDLKIKEDQLKLGNLSSGNASAEIERKLHELQMKEKESLLMKVQLENLKAETTVREEEVKRLREAINQKETEMARREEEVQYKDKILAAERIKLEESKKEVVGVGQLEMKRKLEDLGNEIRAKEEELRNKENWLNAKAEEIRQRESGVIEDDLKARQKEQIVELQQAKAKTGNNRLDDLLYGGIPLGSNIMVHGPPFQGKEVMVNVFVADGLKKGVPVLWVITDKTPKDIRDEMRYVLSGYEEYEARGLVKYVDCYSRSMGDDSQDPYTIYVDEPTDHDKISEMVEVVCKEFKEKAKYYRLAFRSVSTLIAYSDPVSAFKFLSPLCGRRKRDQAVAMFLVEKGMHGEQEIQMLGSIMDGMFDFKIDQMKSYFSVQGIADVQSRSYIRYTSTKHSLNIGSFALDHIR
ncbi:MAG: recombinase RecA [Euryarchaeota archaeon]|nr:recombinase RecA [Euryarchaeota archaeon]